jgi:hypothetical protein
MLVTIIIKFLSLVIISRCHHCSNNITWLLHPLFSWLQALGEEVSLMQKTRNINNRMRYENMCVIIFYKWICVKEANNLCLQ